MPSFTLPNMARHTRNQNIKSFVQPRPLGLHVCILVFPFKFWKVISGVGQNIPWSKSLKNILR